MASHQIADSSGGLLALTMTLTKNGIAQIPFILSLIYQYIELIKNNLDRIKDIYYEMQLIAHLQFKFLSNTTPDDTVVDITKNMDLYPIKNILNANYYFDDFSDEHSLFLNQILSNLSAKNID